MTVSCPPLLSGVKIEKITGLGLIASSSVLINLNHSSAEEQLLPFSSHLLSQFAVSLYLKCFGKISSEFGFCNRRVFFEIATVHQSSIGYEIGLMANSLEKKGCVVKQGYIQLNLVLNGRI